MEEFYYPSRGEGQIRACRWVPEGPIRAVVQIVHGLAESVERYAPFAEFLNDVNLDSRRPWERLAQQPFHQRLLFGPYPTAIKVNIEGRCTGQAVRLEDSTDVILRLMKGVDALRLYSYLDVGTVGQHPVCLGAATVCY